MCEYGNAMELSKDHKPELPEERSRINKSGSEVVDGRVNRMDSKLSLKNLWKCAST